MSARARARATPMAQATMTRFLDAAERVFGKHGYEGTTIRAIAKTAGGNLGTLQHYWGSKRALFRDLFERRLRPLQQEHVRRMRLLEARATRDSRPELLEVVRSLIDTTFLVGIDTLSGYGPELRRPAGRRRFHLLYGRALMDPSPHVIAELTRIFEEPVQLFLRLMRRACPELTAAELDWRVNCIIGAQVFSQVYAERVGRFFGGEADVDDALAARWIVHFLMNGIGAPPASRRQRRLSREA